MKKLSRIAALLAATAMLFGAISCSNGDDAGGDPVDPDQSGPSATFKSETVEVDFQGVTVVSITDGKVADDSIVSCEIKDGTKVFITSKKAGTTTVTAKITVKVENVEQPGTGTITVTVADTGKITYVPNWEGEGDPTDPENPDVPATATNVSFDLTKEGSYATQISAIQGTPIKTTTTGITDGAIYLTQDETLVGSDETTKIVLYSASSANQLKYNSDTAGLIMKTKTSPSMEIQGIVGNVKVTVKWAINGKKPANDRTISVKIGDNEVITVGNSDTVSVASTPVQMENISGTFDFGTGGKTVTIDTSNELGVTGIIIEPVTE